MNHCKHKWVRFNGPEYPYRMGIMVLCDELWGCSKCGCVKARCSTPLEYEDGDFYIPPVIMSGKEYISQINHMTWNWCEAVQPTKHAKEQIELKLTVAEQIGWPAWKELPEGWVGAWKELDHYVNNI